MKLVKWLEDLKLIQKIFIILSVTLLIAVCNFFFYNYQSLRIPKNDRIYNINFNTTEYENFVFNDNNLISQNKKSKITIDFNDRYIRYLVIHYNADKNFNMSIEGDFKNEFEVIREVDSIREVSSTQKKISTSQKIYEQSNASEMNLGAFNVNANVQKITINVEKSDVEITGIVVDNSVFFNWDTFVFLVVLVNVTLIILMFNTILFKRIHILVFLLCMSIGSIYITTVHNIPDVAYDGQDHFKSYNSLEERISQSDYYVENMVFDFKTLDTRVEKDEFNKIMNRNAKNIIEIRNHKMNLLNFNNINKIPEALVLKLTRYLNIPYTIGNVITRIVHLFIYAIIIMFAIKIMPCFKLVSMMICLIPQNLFLATNFNRDTTITAFLFLSFASFLYEYYHKEQKVKKKNVVIFILAGIFGCSAKCIYAPILLLPLLLPKEKFDSKKQCRYFKLVIIIITILVFSTFFLSMFSLLDIDSISDARGGDVSAIRQVQSIFNHPFVFSKMFFKESIFSTIGMLFSPQTITNLSYYEFENDGYYMLFLFSILLAFLSESNQLNIQKSHKIIMGLIYLSIICFIWGSMYISFTPVGENVINGVQCRYFIPLLVPIMCCFSTNKLKNNFRRKNIMIISSIICLLANGLVIYQLIISLYCI